MVNFEYNPITHTYTLNGQILKSVTSFLPYEPKGKISQEVLKQARDNGSNKHFEIELFIKKGVIETDLQKAFSQWYKKILSSYGKILLCETAFFMKISDTYIGGKPDYFFEKGILVDFKSGLSAGIDYFQKQLGAYSMLLEQNGYRVKKTIILTPSNSKKLKLKVIEIKPDKQGFIELVKKWEKENGV